MKTIFGLKKRRRYDKFRSHRSAFRFSKFFFAFSFVLFSGLGLTVLYMMYFSPPDAFSSYQILEIEKGQTLSGVSQKLEAESYVRDAQVFEWAVMLLEGERNVVAGSYYFEEKLGTIEMAKHLTTGEFGFMPKRVTIPEGFTVAQIAERLTETFPLISQERFMTFASPREGFLFPDTYDFFPNVGAKKVIETMAANFERKTADLQEEIKENPERTLREVIIMASILEEEAHTTESRRMIAGILWDRLEAGMPLQVDATFAYFLGKSTYELTTEDLAIDSPYNTYLYKGLPIGPITNPGLDSIKAAMHPIETEYVYYLSDREGNVYYSTTLAEHRRLKEIYVN